ncbi:MAG TPA: hypothetical protein VI112_08785 [Bacteroidia bacterium]|jgi:hypothetical protein
MKQRYGLIIAIFLLSFSSSFGQIRPYDKKVFRAQFEQGNLLVLEQFYDTALKTFLFLHEMDTANANVNYKVGFLYLQSSSKKNKALPYLISACKNTSKKYIEFEASEKHAPEIALYYLALAYHLDYKFDDAIATFEKYKTIIGTKNQDILNDVNHRIDWCRNAKQFVSTPVPYIITNLGDSVNSPYAEYSPVISADEEVLMYTSTRKGTGGEANQTPEGGYFEDIWVCYKKKDGTWTEAKSIGPPINTFDNEATIGLSADGQQLFIYKDDNGDGNIYLSELNGDVWNAPEKIGEGKDEVTDINTNAWETHACVTADGNTLYFVSDRKGGFGGRDIYKCVKLPNGKWSKARNLGPTVNTPYDEDAPFIHPDGVTLFFSSKGHNSMGGFDIFFATRSDSGWTEPINMGYPLNTPDDDVFYVLSTDGRRAYFSSFREDGKGEKDIYMATTPAPPHTEPVALIIGYLKYVNGDHIDPSTVVHLTSVETGEIKDFIPNRNSGKVIFTLPPCKPYTLTVEVNGSVIYTDEKFKSDCIDFNETQKENKPITIWLGGPPPTDTLSGKLLTISSVLSDKDSKPKGNVTVKLTDNRGDVSQTSSSDAKGEFHFSGLKNDRNYMIEIDAYDDELKPGTPIKIMSGNQEIGTVRVANKPNKVKYLISSTDNTVTLNIKKRGEVLVNNDKDKDKNPKPKVEFITIEGTVMDKSSPDKPLLSVTGVTITDDKSSMTMNASTSNGHFIFTHVPAGNNYLINVDEFNTVAAHFKTIKVTDETSGKELSNMKTSSSPDDKFKVNETKKLVTLRLKRKDKDENNISKDYATTNEDKLKQFGDAVYEHHFTYSQTEIDKNADDFNKLIDAIISRYNSTGYCKVYLNCSASRVPVHSKYKDNYELAKSRGSEAESLIIAALKAKGFDVKNIVFTMNYNVKGPEYRGDYVENRGEYERWQYVKVFLLDKK